MVLAGGAQAARNGVLIKGGVHLENLVAVKAIAFDKTYTITRGEPAVTDIDGASLDQVLAVAAAVESRSSHPFAQAVLREAERLKLTLPPAGELQPVTVRGVHAEYALHKRLSTATAAWL